MCYDVLDSLIVLDKFLMMTPALIRAPASQKLSHFGKDLALPSAFPLGHNLKVILEELDVLDLLLA